MGDKPNEPPTTGDHERALVESALREAAEHAKVASANAAHPPSVRARLGGGPFVLPPSDTFPGYELLRELHRGGQGVVYQAIQKTTRRKVAIKVMREGPFASQREHARFEREAQVLGQLNHPGIVSIHDSGTTAHGLSFFVMDYISGTPLDVYAASVKGSVEDAMRLMLGVCEAVSAAHLKGIIHRDLKPGNIIVDGEGKPHILDFGLAKVAGGETTGQATLQLMTITGQFLGSMPWASPEQAEGRSEKIDVRTDVYSLGVIAYQTLAGKFPYDVVGSMREVMDQIQNVAPAPLRKIRKQIDEDAERIVLKCLCKERERRYQSAAELVRDIQHYLNHEPIEARRDSLSYVLKMHLKKRKLAVAVIAPLILAVAVGSVTSVVLWRKAERESAEATALTHFLARGIQKGKPESDKDLTVRDMLGDMALELKRGFFEAQPAVNAAAYEWIGETYLSNGDPKEAEEFLRAAVTMRDQLYGPKDVGTAQACAYLGRALIERDQYGEAEKFLKRALGVQERKLRGNDPALGRALGDMGVLRQHTGNFPEAEKLYERAIAIHTANKDLSELAPIQFNMAGLLDDKGLLKDAETYYEKALVFYASPGRGDKPDKLAWVLAGYGWNLTQQGRACEAITHLERAWQIREHVLQESDWHRAWTQSCLGDSLAHCPGAAERAGEAEKLLVQSWESLRGNTLAPSEPKQRARERVVEFYEARGEKAKAAEIRAQQASR
jgi:serine/threonine protein kinase